MPGRLPLRQVLSTRTAAGGRRVPRYTGSGPYEITRDIDHSFGYDRNSGPDAFIGRQALASLVRDTAADGGNLLLDVGPRGEDATIPAEQRLRPDWLAEEALGADRGATA